MAYPVIFTNPREDHHHCNREERKTESCYGDMRTSKSTGQEPRNQHGAGGFTVTLSYHARNCTEPGEGDGGSRELACLVS